MKESSGWKIVKNRRSQFAQGKYNLSYEKGTKVIKPYGTLGLMFYLQKPGIQLRENELLVRVKASDVHTYQDKGFGILSTETTEKGLDIFYTSKVWHETRKVGVYEAFADELEVLD